MISFIRPSSHLTNSFLPPIVTAKESGREGLGTRLKWHIKLILWALQLSTISRVWLNKDSATPNIYQHHFDPLLAGTPKHLDYEAVKADLNSVEGVKQAHSLHIWSLTLNRTALSAHLALGKCTRWRSYAVIFVRTTSRSKVYHEIPISTICQCGSLALPHSIQMLTL